MLITFKTFLNIIYTNCHNYNIYYNCANKINYNNKEYLWRILGSINNY